MVPTKLFLTKGEGIHQEKLESFEMALRNAQIEKCNLVRVSSIIPPNCKIISKDKGVRELHPGQITYCVLAQQSTNEPNRRIVGSIGLAIPEEKDQYGYLSEHHAFGQTDQATGEYAEKLAKSMLATALGIKEEQITKTNHCTQSAVGDKNGQWTTVIAAAIFLP